jgi:UDP-N-acetylglucosamine 2-epimerase (non-hydrolysing)
MSKGPTKITVIIGTRPEAIKLIPLINELKKYKIDFRVSVCVTGQHREMLDQVLKIFDIIPDYDLNIMTADQSLSSLSSKIFDGLSSTLESINPDYVVVQGDTTTTFISSVVAFYQKIKVIHIEAGLRTSDKWNPFPEEMNRRLTSHISDLHFCPTSSSKDNLLREGILKDNIYIVGNTVIDSLLSLIEIQKNPTYSNKMTSRFLDKYNLDMSNIGKIILVTSHRRENIGTGFKNICNSLLAISINNPEIEIIFPVHLNPNIRDVAFQLLDDRKNIFLLDPIDYEEFVFLLSHSYLVLTDSGGVQEEAPSLGKPVLVLRDSTERPEGVNSGTAIMVGTDPNIIVKETESLLYDESRYRQIAHNTNPYGDGTASKNIVEILKTIIC